MGDAFVPEADALDQEREVAGAPVSDPEAPSRDQPLHIPVEASDADVLEQAQEVEDDDDWR